MASAEVKKAYAEANAEAKKQRLAKLESEEMLKECNGFKEPVTAMLQVATFAAAITFNIVLTPRDSQDTLGLVYLGYANSLFCGGIIGCVFIIITTEICRKALDRQHQAIKSHPFESSTSATDLHSYVELACPKAKTAKTAKIAKMYRFTVKSLILFLTATAGVVGAMLFVAFYLMLYAALLYLNFDGPFILGSVFYLSFGLITLILWLWAACDFWPVNLSIQTREGIA